MEISEFINITNRIEKYYGKEYSNEQRKIMFEELGDMSIERLQQSVKSCIRSCKYMPKIADIIQASSEIKIFEKKREYTPCKMCDGVGFIKYYKILQENDYEYEFMCKCTCKNGEYYNKRFPTYEDLGIQKGEKLVINFNK